MNVRVYMVPHDGPQCPIQCVFVYGAQCSQNGFQILYNPNKVDTEDK